MKKVWDHWRCWRCQCAGAGVAIVTSEGWMCALLPSIGVMKGKKKLPLTWLFLKWHDLFVSFSFSFYFSFFFFFFIFFSHTHTPPSLFFCIPPFPLITFRTLPLITMLSLSSIQEKISSLVHRHKNTASEVVQTVQEVTIPTASKNWDFSITFVGGKVSNTSFTTNSTNGGVPARPGWNIK